jgi:hypothetical protein
MILNRVRSLTLSIDGNRARDRCERRQALNVGRRRYHPRMDDLPEDPQTLYQAWKGHWPFRQWLYVGITNSPSSRFGEHHRRSEWMLEAGTIRLTRYPDRESVSEAERYMIRAKRPYYNVQHNRHEVGVELSPENAAALGAAICLAILSLRWLADASSEWWVQRQAERQGLSVELPPRRDPFTEPSVTLTFLHLFCAMLGGAPLAEPPQVAPVPQLTVQPPAGATANPRGSQLPQHQVPVAASQPVSLLSPVGVIVALCMMFAQRPVNITGTARAGSRNAL